MVRVAFWLTDRLSAPGFGPEHEIEPPKHRCRENHRETWHYKLAGCDGKTLNTAAIQATIAACGPGDLVRIPKGVFLSGALFLKSNMTLLLEQGAVLLGSPDAGDYPLMQYRWEG